MPSEWPRRQVGDARSVLLEQYIHACRPQRGDQEVVAVQGISKHHIASGEASEQGAHQPEFAAAFAAVWPEGRIERRAAGQANHQDQSGQGKADPAAAWVLGWG